MTSNSARTALGAGASLALRPTTSKLHVGSQGYIDYSAQGHADYSGRESGHDSSTEIFSPAAERKTTITTIADAEHMKNKDRGSGGRSTSAWLFQSLGSSISSIGTSGGGKRGRDNKSKNKRSGNSKDNNNGNNNKNNSARDRVTSSAPSPPPPPLKSLPPAGLPPVPPGPHVTTSPRLPRLSDPLRQSRLSASAVLPENEAVEDDNLDPAPSAGAGSGLGGDGGIGGSADLGWGGGNGAVDDGAMPPPPPPPPLGGGSVATRARWGSGHYYTVRFYRFH